ncbi:hypothetical protein N8987_01795 [Crocinitomix sp.]|nr:hypothetical protein [Crocinitomix sp.]
MKEDDNILNQFKLGAKPTVPNHYFDNFYSQLMERIELESGILSQLQKRDKPSLPADYFENFSDSMGDNQADFGLENLKKSVQPKVEDGFFKSFPEQILIEIEKEGQSKSQTKIIAIKWATAFISTAAALLIFFNILDFSSNNNPVKTEVTAQLSDESEREMYLSYIDEDELIEFIIEEDIAIQEDEIELEDYYDYSEEEIEDLYLEY